MEAFHCFEISSQVVLQGSSRTLECCTRLNTSCLFTQLLYILRKPSKTPEWELNLHSYLLNLYNMVIHTSTNKSPSKAFFGYLLPSPLDVVYEHPNREKNKELEKLGWKNLMTRRKPYSQETLFSLHANLSLIRKWVLCYAKVDES